MSIKIGNISAKDIYIGSTPAKEIRLGSTLIWSRAQEEVYYTLTIDASGASNLDYVSGQYQAPNSSEWAPILNADGDYHLVNQDSILLPAGSLISLSVSSMDSNPISISINNFILSENTTVYFTSEVSHYTLTVNIEGNSEAYYDGYTIYVNESEFARIDHSDTFSIPNGATVRTHNNSFGINGYKHSESIVPLPSPSFSTGDSWVMDKNYSITVVAEKNYTLTINLGEGVDYSDIWYKEPGATEWVERSKYTSLNAPAGTKFYVIAGPVNGYAIDSSINLGSQSNPLELNADITIDITAHPVVIENNYTLTIDASGASNFDYAFGQYKAPNSSEWVQILDANGDHHLDNQESILLPAGSLISLSVSSMDSIPISISINNFILSENTTVYFTSVVYYTLTIDASGAINANGDSIFDYAFGQYKAPNSSEWVQILDAGGDYHLDNQESISLPAGSEISLAVNSMDYSIPISISINDFILSENTTVYFIAQLMYTLTINLGEGVDYSDIWYKEPNATEWTEASKYTSLTAPAGTKFYIYTQPMNGYKIDSDINLGSQSNPLELNADITIDITAHLVVIEQYEFNVARGGGASIASIAIKIGNDVVYSRSGSNLSGTEYPIQHDGSKPIYVKVGTLGYIESWTWSGSSGFTLLPSAGYDGYQILFENLQETGTLTVNLTSS